MQDHKECGCLFFCLFVCCFSCLFVCFSQRNQMRMGFLTKFQPRITACTTDACTAFLSSDNLSQQSRLTFRFTVLLVLYQPVPRKLYLKVHIYDNSPLRYESRGLGLFRKGLVQTMTVVSAVHTLRVGLSVSSEV